MSGTGNQQPGSQPVTVGEAESAQVVPAPSLGTRVVVRLDGLGGRSAIVARRFPVPTLPRRAMRTSEVEHEGHEHVDAPGRISSSVEESIAVRGDEIFPAASLAKLGIAVELMRRVDLRQYDLSEQFNTADEPRVGGGGVLDYLDSTTHLTLNDLCFLMLGVSDNSASNFLLELLGMGEINETMARLKLEKTRLARRFMDWAAREAHRENVTSAEEMVTLLALLRGNALPGASVLRGMLAAQQRADDIQTWLPTEAQLSHKTGELEGIFHDAGMLAGPGGACVFCILTAEQRHLPTTRFVVGEVIRMLWDGWCAG
ncbi:MAG: serine hydrolase [Ktedonobacterales bacterium]